MFSILSFRFFNCTGTGGICHQTDAMFDREPREIAAQ